MKTKKILFILLFFKVCLSLKACNTSNPKDTLREILEINTMQNSFLKDISSIDLSTIYNDTLYIIVKNHLILVDLKKKQIAENYHLSNFLNEQLKKGKNITKLIVDNNGYWIAFSQELYNISKNGNINYYYSHDKEIYYFSITNDKYILISSHGKITYLNYRLEVIANEFDDDLSTPNYFQYKDGIGFLGVRKIILFYNNNSKIEKEIFNINLTEGQDENFFPSYATDKFIVGFSYFQRNHVYIIPFKNSKIQSKIINFSKDFSPTQDEMQAEEGIPNFKIIGGSNSCYIIAFNNNRLVVLYATF